MIRTSLSRQPLGNFLMHAPQDKQQRLLALAHSVLRRVRGMPGFGTLQDCAGQLPYSAQALVASGQDQPPLESPAFLSAKKRKR